MVLTGYRTIIVRLLISMRKPYMHIRRYLWVAMIACEWPGPLIPPLDPETDKVKNKLILIKTP